MTQYGDLPPEIVKKIVEEVFDNHTSNYPHDLTIFDLARTNKTLRDMSLEVMYPRADEIKVTYQSKPLIDRQRLHLRQMIPSAYLTDVIVRH